MRGKGFRDQYHAFIRLSLSPFPPRHTREPRDINARARERRRKRLRVGERERERERSILVRAFGRPLFFDGHERERERRWGRGGGGRVGCLEDEEEKVRGEEARNSRVPKYSGEVGRGGGDGGRALGVLLKRAKTFPSFPPPLASSLALARPAKMHPRNCRVG